MNVLAPSSLEEQLQRELDIARQVALITIQSAEVCLLGICKWICPPGMVKRVKEFATKLQTVSLSGAKLLHDRKINIVLWRSSSVAHVVRKVANVVHELNPLVGTLGRGGTPGIPARVGGKIEATDIDHRDSTSDQVMVVFEVQGLEIAEERAISKVDGRSALGLIDSLALPAAHDCIQPSRHLASPVPAAAKGGLANESNCDPVRNVVAGKLFVRDDLKIVVESKPLQKLGPGINGIQRISFCEAMGAADQAGRKIVRRNSVHDVAATVQIIGVSAYVGDIQSPAPRKFPLYVQRPVLRSSGLDLHRKEAGAGAYALIQAQCCTGGREHAQREWIAYVGEERQTVIVGGVDSGVLTETGLVIAGINASNNNGL